MADISSVGAQQSQLPNVQEVDGSKAVSREMRQVPEQQGGMTSEVQQTSREQARQELARMSSEELDELKNNLNEALEPINIKLQFTEDDDSGRMVVKVLDRDKDEVIRQIPPESMLKMAQRMEELSGMLIDTWS